MTSPGADAAAWHDVMTRYLTRIGRLPVREEPCVCGSDFTCMAVEHNPPCENFGDCELGAHTREDPCVYVGIPR